MADTCVCDARFARCEQRDKQLTKKRQVYARQLATHSWRLKSQEVAKPHRAARTALRTCLAQQLVETAADIPQICGRDRLGAHKPSISGSLATTYVGDDEGCMRVPAIDYSTDEITQVILEHLMVSGKLCARAAEGSESADDMQGSDSQSDISDFELVANSLVLEVDDGVSEWNLV